MAEEVVVKDELTPEMLAAGRELTKQFQASDPSLVCALWNYVTEANRWRLLFATSRVDTEGPLKVYETIQEILQRRAIGIDLSRISLLGPGHPLVRGLKSLFKIEGGFADIKFGRSRINDLYVEDTHILYLK